MSSTRSRLALLALAMALCVSCASARAGRQKRFVYFNHDTDMTVGLLVGVPISVSLPSLLPGKTFGRSLEGTGLPEVTDTIIDPGFPEEEDRLQQYFAHLQIPEGPCQRRILCEIASSPEYYFPASEILLKPLDLGTGAAMIQPNSRLHQLLMASKVGFNQGLPQCKKLYGDCPVGADDSISRFGLKMWQYLASKLNISFQH